MVNSLAIPKSEKENWLQVLPVRIWKGRWGYFFIAPALIPFIIFTVYPLLQGILLSFYRAGSQP